MRATYDVKSQGCDYLTATRNRDEKSTLFNDVGRGVIAAIGSRGYKVRTWGYKGYRGLTTTNAAWGIRADSSIIRVESEAALEFGPHVFPLATNVSRFDAQVTIDCGEDYRKVMLDHHEEIANAPAKRGRPVKWLALNCEAGPCGLNVGRRISDVFLRCYNRGYKHRVVLEEGLLRYEIEFKREVALAKARQYFESSAPGDTARYQVHTLVCARSLTPRFGDVCVSEITGHTFAPRRVQRATNIWKCINSLVLTCDDPAELEQLLKVLQLGITACRKKLQEQQFLRVA